MLRNRPSYDFVKKASEYEMDEFVINSYTSYKKEKGDKSLSLRDSTHE